MIEIRWASVDVGHRDGFEFEQDHPLVDHVVVPCAVEQGRWDGVGRRCQEDRDAWRPRRRVVDHPVQVAAN